METIHNYRHIVDGKTAKIFEKALCKAIASKPYKKIGFIGIILDYKKKEHHDLDVLIFPQKNVKIGESILEVMELYKETEKELKKIHERYYLATASRKITQELTYYLAGLEEGSAGLVPVHSLFFPDYKSFIKYNPEKFVESIKDHLIELHGKFEIIKDIPEIPQEKLEPYFVILDFEMNARIRTFPRHNIRASAESLFNYLKDKYDLEVNAKIPEKIEEIEKEFKKLIMLIDKRTYG